MKDSNFKYLPTLYSQQVLQLAKEDEIQSYSPSKVGTRVRQPGMGYQECRHQWSHLTGHNPRLRQTLYSHTPEADAATCATSLFEQG